MEPQKSSIGGIIGTIIIIAIIVLGGLYFWGKRIEESKARQQLVTDSIPPQTETDETTIIKDVSTSTEADSLETGLNATTSVNIEAE